MKLQHISNLRDYSIVKPTIAEELAINDNEDYVFDLDYLGIIAVKGDNGVNFLQGQISADMRKVTANTIVKGALCNLQGRVLALMHVVQSNILQLILPNDLTEIVLSDLKMPAMFSKVELEPIKNFKIFGYLGHNHSKLLPYQLPQEKYSASLTDDYFIYNIGNNFYIVGINKQASNDDLMQKLQEHNNFRGSLAWHYLMLKHKVAEIYPTTSGLFLPHRLNLHNLDFLSFDKGCYKGQEIIARMHYKSKKHYILELHEANDEEKISPGKNFVDKNNTDNGAIIDYVLTDKDKALILTSKVE